MDGVWMVYGWCMDGVWVVYEECMEGTEMRRLSYTENSLQTARDY